MLCSRYLTEAKKIYTKKHSQKPLLVQEKILAKNISNHRACNMMDSKPKATPQSKGWLIVDREYYYYTTTITFDCSNAAASTLQ